MRILPSFSILRRVLVLWRLFRDSSPNVNDSEISRFRMGFVEARNPILDLFWSGAKSFLVSLPCEAVRSPIEEAKTFLLADLGPPFAVEVRGRNAASGLSLGPTGCKYGENKLANKLCRVKRAAYGPDPPLRRT